MTSAEKKLDYLQHCLGEKKLKQLGLISCQTCKEALTEVINLTLPTNLDNKSFFTTEEISTFSGTITPKIDDQSIDTSVNKNPDSIHVESLPSELEASTSHSESNDFDISSTAASVMTDHVSTPSEHTSDSINISSNTHTITEEDLVTKLLTILNQSYHIPQDNLGIGYIYSPPAINLPKTYTLCCSECGRLYTIATDPNPHLFPLPVYLTDTEYEMIKGIYVDICL